MSLAHAVQTDYWRGAPDCQMMSSTLSRAPDRPRREGSTRARPSLTLVLAGLRWGMLFSQTAQVMPSREPSSGSRTMKG